MYPLVFHEYRYLARSVLGSSIDNPGVLDYILSSDWNIITPYRMGYRIVPSSDTLYRLSYPDALKVSNYQGDF